jgi:alkyl hydroperoxide reductase subunit AhpC
VLSVSVDSIYVHKMWNEHELSKMINKDIPFAMLSDQDGSIGKIYGIYDEDSGVETRGRFIIDPDGNIQGFEVLTPSVGRNVSESIRQNFNITCKYAWTNQALKKQMTGQ